MDKRRLALGTLVGGVANLFKVCLQILMLPLMARLLGPNEYGLYALAMPIITFVAMLADGGFGSSLARESEANAEVWSSALWTLLGAAVFLGAAAIIWSVFARDLAHQPRLPSIVAALTASLFFYVAGIPSGARLIRQGRLLIGPTGEILGAIAGSICAVALALSGAGVWSMVTQTVVTSTVKFLVLYTAAPILPGLGFSFFKLRNHLTMGAAIVGSKLVDTGDRALENTLIGRNLGTAFLGSFSLANQITRFVFEAVIGPLWLTLYVQALQTEDVRRFQNYPKLARLAALILFPAATLGAAEADFLIERLLGPSWLAMSPLFQLLLLTYAFGSAGTLGGAILYAKGQASIQLRITAEAATIRIVSVLLSFWTGPWVLWVGLPAANVLAGWRGAIASCRSADLSPFTLIKPLLIPGVCAVGAGLFCWSTTRFFQSSIIIVLLELTSSFSVYLLLLILLDRERLSNDLMGLLWLLPRRVSES
jgi:O-antigen/teichoic acid export membrane protein